MSEEEAQLQSFTIDQAAGALALSLGALGSLLLVIWQSRCMCRCRIGCSDECYIFDCMRQPPPDEENPDDKKKDKKDKKKDKVGGSKGNSEKAGELTRPVEEPTEKGEEDEELVPPPSDITATITES